MPTKTLLVKYNFSNWRRRDPAANFADLFKEANETAGEVLLSVTTKARDWVKVIALEFAGLLR